MNLICYSPLRTFFRNQLSQLKIIWSIDLKRFNRRDISLQNRTTPKNYFIVKLYWLCKQKKVLYRIFKYIFFFFSGLFNVEYYVLDNRKNSRYHIGIKRINLCNVCRRPSLFAFFWYSWFWLFTVTQIAKNERKLQFLSYISIIWA